ncbi:MAG: hypothetical protein ABSB35_04660 [Bryobacteraceae bacterium]
MAGEYGWTPGTWKPCLKTPRQNPRRVRAPQGLTRSSPRKLEDGWFQHIEIPLPAVLTIQSGINKQPPSAAGPIQAE